MAKKTLKKSDVINRNKSEYDDNLTKIIIILGIVLAMFVTIYIGTALVRGEWKSKDEEEKKEVTIQTEEILAGATFKITDKEYIVLYYSFKGNDAGLFDMLYSGYSTSSSVKIYKVNLDSGFNKKYVSDKTVSNRANYNLAEITKIPKLKTNFRITRLKLDLILPISFTIIWVILIVFQIV